jgi:hypothetical protein
MGQSIVVKEKPSSTRGVTRFETNRALTGMDHERYVAGQEVWGDRPPDELARRLLAQPSVAGVQINSNMITVDLEKGYDSGGLLEVIENLYRFYPDAPDGAEEPAAADDAAPAPEPAPEPEAAPEPVADPEVASQAEGSEEPSVDPAPTDPVAEPPAGAATADATVEDATAQPAAADDDEQREAPAPEADDPEG